MADSNFRTLECYKEALRNLRLPQLRKAMEFAEQTKSGNKPKLVQKAETLLYMGFSGFGAKILELESEQRNSVVKKRNGVLPKQPGSVQRLTKPQVFPKKVPRAGSHSNSNLFPGSGSGPLLNLSSQSQTNDGVLLGGVPVSPIRSNCNSATFPALTPPVSLLAKKTRKRITIRPSPKPSSTVTSTPTRGLSVILPKTPDANGSVDDDVEILEVPENQDQGLAKCFKTVQGWSMWPMPFHEVLKVILPPTELQIEEKLKFELMVAELEPEENSDGVHLTKREVFLRFCVHDGISMELEPDDLFPPTLHLKVNQIPIPFNQTSMQQNLKKCSQPINVTKHINSPSKELTVEVGWTKPSDSNSRSSSLPRYYMSAYLCKSLTVEQLRRRVAAQPLLLRSHTLSKIQKILEDSEVESASSAVKISLLCPYSMQRIRTPCIGIKCTHYASFDLFNFLQTSLLAKHTRLRCPICQNPLKIEEVRIDQFYVTLLEELPPNLKEVEVDSDGSMNNGKSVGGDEAIGKLKAVKKAISTRTNSIPPVPVQSAKKSMEYEAGGVVCLD